MPLVITVKVIPSSGRSQCSLDAAGRLKCHLKSPPERGKANTELCAMLAKAVRVTRDAVTIMAGQTSRTKTVKLDADITFDQLLAALGIERQIGLFEQGGG